MTGIVKGPKKGDAEPSGCGSVQNNMAHGHEKQSQKGCDPAATKPWRGQKANHPDHDGKDEGMGKPPVSEDFGVTHAKGESGHVKIRQNRGDNTCHCESRRDDVSSKTHSQSNGGCRMAEDTRHPVEVHQAQEESNLPSGVIYAVLP